VHPTAGTTRDIVAAPTAIEGWPIELSDTAGLGETDHPIELAGMHLARRKLAEADLVVLVFDASQAWSARGERVLHNYPRALVVHNKIDLTVADRPSRPSGVLVSAATGEGADELVQAIASRLVPEELPEGAAVPFAGVQVDCLRAAAAAIRRGNLSDAKAILLRL
jgi:tRNA modification GTPase